MKIIDILNKIANNEEPPKKIRYDDTIYDYDETDKDYYNSATYGLFDSYEIPPMLNDEVEILEITITYNQDSIENNKQDKIEKIDTNKYYITECNKIAIEEMMDKINEIIEVLNER